MITNVMERLIDFTRISGGGYFGPDGLFRFTPASRNLLTYTQEFDNAAWIKGGGTPTVTANSIAAPDGTMTADTINQTSSTNAFSVSQIAPTATIGLPYTWSIYLKQGTSRYTQLTFTSATFGAVQYANIDLQTGAVTQSAGSPTVVITSAGNGWYRVAYTATATAAAAATPFIVLINSATDVRVPTITGSSANTIYAWGAQLEQASSATDYTRNAGGLYPPRFDYDPVTLAPRGLLIEEQRTNLLLRSEEFENAAWSKSDLTVTANAAASPNGTADADLCVEGTAGTGVITQGFVGSANATFTASIYVKRGNTDWVRFTYVETAAAGNRITGWFNLATGAVGSFSNGGTATGASGAITNVGSGWYRISMSGAVNNSATAFTLSITSASANSSTTRVNNAEYYLWGAQLEAGTFATSYIPTVASQVTRTADNATITGANFSRWYNQTSGTFLVEWRQGGSEAVQIAASVNDGTANNIMSVLNDNSSAAGVTPGAAVTNGGVAQANLTGAAITAGSTNKTALAYALNDFAYSQNGAAALTDTSGTIPTVDRLDIGNRVSALFTNGHIRRIKYYPARLSNAQIQALTA